MTFGKPFKPGQSGNPNGRPKNRPFKAALDRILKEEAKGEDESGGLDEVVRALYVKAKTGDVAAIKEIAERYDGKVAQALIGGDEDDPPIRISRIELVAAQPKPAGDGPDDTDDSDDSTS